MCKAKHDAEVIAACKECGSTGVIMRGEDGYYIQCVQCHATSNDYEYIDDAIAHWNEDNHPIKIGECVPLASCSCEEDRVQLYLRKKWDGTRWNYWILVEESGNNHAIEFDNLLCAVDCFKMKVASYLV